MSEMVERVARGIAGADGCDDAGWDAMMAWSLEYYRGRARAAIEAMREPTERMVASATWPMIYDSSGAGTNRSPRQAWELMIDEALK